MFIRCTGFVKGYTWIKIWYRLINPDLRWIKLCPNQIIIRSLILWYVAHKDLTLILNLILIVYVIYSPDFGVQFHLERARFPSQECVRMNKYTTNVSISRPSIFNSKLSLKNLYVHLISFKKTNLHSCWN